MSYWVHFSAVIRLYTGTKTLDEIKNKFKNAPQIIGTEENAKLYFNKPSGYNLHLDRDCWHCPKEKLLYKYKLSSSECEFCDETKFRDYQTETIITIVGDLRSSIEQQARQEYDNLLNFITNNTKFNIKYEYCNIPAE